MERERQLDRLDLELPSPPVTPPGVEIPFAWARVSGSRVLLSGHGALGPDGTPTGPFGQVPSEVRLELAQASAQRATLALLSSLRAAVGDLDRVTAWLTGEVGAHARTAIGAATLPFNLPVVIAAELEISR